jgi:hypothetical protein
MADSALVKKHYDAIVRTGRAPSFAELDQALPTADPKIKRHLATLYEEAGLNATIQRVAKKVQSAASNYGNLPANIYVGMYPTGSFNAQVSKTVDGPLILINTGTEFFIIEIVKLFVAGTFAFVESAADASEKELRNAIGMNEAQVSEQLARLLYAYVALGDAAAARKLPMMEGESLIAVSVLAWAAQEFLVAHEYGHIIKGHLDGREPRNAVAEGGSLKVNWMNVEQEAEADFSALRICTALTLQETGERIDTPDKLIKLQFRFAGPTIFFALSDLIEEAFKSLIGKRGYILIGDHPPTPMRLKFCNEYLAGIAGERSVEIAKMFKSWLDHYSDTVIELIRKLVTS